MYRTPKIYFVGVLALALLIILTPALPAREIAGAVVSIQGDQREFVMVRDLEEMTFRLDAYGKVFINDEIADLSDLQSGDDVAVVFELREDERVASTVRCTRKP